MVQFGCLVQGCGILINSLFYCTKFREELNLKFTMDFPLPIFIVKKTEKNRKKVLALVGL